MTESERLIEYVTKRHEIRDVDFTCQFKAGKGERKYCRATSQKKCTGCRFYRMSVWHVFNRAYDLLTAKDKQIKQLTDDNCKLLNALEDAAAYVPAEIGLKIDKTIKAVMVEGK